MSTAQLQEVFMAFASFGASTIQREIDSSKFTKLCKDTNIIDKKCSKTDVDLIFTRAKAKGERKLNFSDFLNALQMIAEKKGTGIESLVNQIVAAGGPTINGTVADAVRFHDDKSTFTGVYAKGGPTNIDRNNVSLGFLLDRTSADVRGVKAQSTLAAMGESVASLNGGLDAMRMDDEDMSPMIAPTQRPPATPSGLAPIPQQAGPIRPSSSAGRTFASSTSTAATNAAQQQQQLPHIASSATGRPSSSYGRSASGVEASSTCIPQPQLQQTVPSSSRLSSRAAPAQMKPDPRVLEEAMYQTFSRFVTGTGDEIDSFKFIKMLKDNSMLDKKLSQTTADLIFTKAKTKGAKKLGFVDFREVAVPLLAEAKGCGEMDIVSQLAASSGPKLSGTVPDAVRFHDDKSCYTGVYAKGGPTNIDHVMSLSALADRGNEADVRGVIRDANSHHSATANYMNTSLSSSNPGPSAGIKELKTTSSRGEQRRESAPTTITNAIYNAGGQQQAGGGSIFDRLNDKSTYTGVYAKRFDGSDGLGGRINDDMINSNRNGGFNGSTAGAKTDQKVRDLSDILSRR